jgi:hypothetical protein
MAKLSKPTRSTTAGAGAVVGTSGLATFIVWLFGHFGVSLSAEDGSIIAGAVSTVTLLVWHTGIRNILRGIWIGHTQAPQVAPQAK